MATTSAEALDAAEAISATSRATPASPMTLLLALVAAPANFLTDLYAASPILDEHHVDLKAGCEQEKGLRRWLCEATVHIPLPPIEVDVPVVGIEVITLDGLACGGVSLGPISSSVDLSASKPSLSLSAKDASFNCSVKHFTFEQKGGGILKGDGTATIGVSGATFGSTLELTIDKATHLATAMDLKGTALTLDKLDIKLKGSALTWLLDKLEGLLQGVLKTTLEKQVITLVDDLVATNGTQASERERRESAARAPAPPPTATARAPPPPPGADPPPRPPPSPRRCSCSTAG